MKIDEYHINPEDTCPICCVEELPNSEGNLELKLKVDFPEFEYRITEDGFLVVASCDGVGYYMFKLKSTT